MANQEQPNNSNTADEIDLGQLLNLIKKGFHNLGNFFLRIFIYLRKNVFKILGLIVLGVAISLGLNALISKKLKTDVIVQPNFDSKNYLYEVVDEIEANVKAKNANFFKSLDINVEDLNGFKVSVEAIEDEEIKTEDAVSNEMKYLEILENFKEESFVLDILRSELSEKSVLNHRISFSYNDRDAGPVIAGKLMNYINNNPYFEKLKEVYSKNAQLRIEQNTKRIVQIDQLIENFTKGMLTDKKNSGTIYLEQENPLNVTGLLSQKSLWSKEIEEKNLELAQQADILRIINIGEPQEVSKQFFNQPIFIIPIFLVLAFFLFSGIGYLNQKSKEIE